jgi:hypothetical protein
VTQKRKRSDDEGESEVGGEIDAEGESEVGGESNAEGESESEVEDDDEKDGDYMGDGKKRTAKVCLFLYTHPTALF